MARDQIDALWQQAMHDAIAEGEQMTRYHFAALVAAAEREACAQLCEQYDDDGGAGETWGPRFAQIIRARGADE